MGQDPENPTDPANPENAQPEQVIANRLRAIDQLAEEELPGAIAGFVANELPAICNRAFPADKAKAQALRNRVATKLILR